MDLIAIEWAKECGGISNVDRRQNKIRHLRQFLRGWAKNQNGLYKVEKERLIQLINELDLKAESNLLNVSDRTIESEAEQKLRALLREEEMKWALRAKVKKVVQGDDNTQFFSHDNKWEEQKEENYPTRTGRGYDCRASQPKVVHLQLLEEALWGPRR